MRPQAADGGKLLGAGRKKQPHCRLHLKMTYLPVGEATMRRAEVADPSAPTDLPGILASRCRSCSDVLHRETLIGTESYERHMYPAA